MTSRIININDRIRHIVNDRRRVDVVRAFAVRNGVVCVVIERFGTDRYIQESNAKRLHEDEYGVLWQARFSDDEPITMVEVRDPSTDRTYFLQVHERLCPLLPDGTLGEPQALTAHNAVASTFGLRGEGYLPAFEA